MTLLNEAVVLTTDRAWLFMPSRVRGRLYWSAFYALPRNPALSSLYFSFPALLKSLELSVKLMPLEPVTLTRRKTLSQVKAAPVSLGEADLASARATCQTL